MSMMHGFSTEEATLVRDSMTKTYDAFKKRVSDGRCKALRGDLESLAGGRLCSGKAALAVRLVDEIGGFHDAIAYAASQVKPVN
jgi:protease-4